MGCRYVQEYYRYDRLGRIRQSRRGATGLTNDDCKLGYQRVDPAHPSDPDLNYNHITDIGNYGTSYLYDRGGNLKSLNRIGDGIHLIDKLQYTYQDAVLRPNYLNGGTISMPSSNQLKKVKDNSDDPVLAEREKGLPTALQEYNYDGDGNLEFDNENQYIWSVSGKLAEVKEKTTATVKVKYLYDAMGNRALKWTPTKGQLYLRDGTGNELASIENTGTNTILKEANIFGSDRIGAFKPETETAGGFTLANRTYDLKDHLGNIRATITDEREKSGYFLLPKVQNASEYYPFGMETDKNFALTGKENRFGYNGKEKDLTLDPRGGILDYGARLYDRRIGRWRSIDPKLAMYPGLSPYSSVDNSPINLIDSDGRVIKIPDGTGGYVTYTPGMRVDGLKPQTANTILKLNAINTDQLEPVIETLTGSDVNYVVLLGNNEVLGKKIDKGEGETSYNFDDNQVELRVNSTDGEATTFAALGDELAEAYLFENGEIGFSESGPLGNDVDDEVNSKYGALAAIKNACYKISDISKSHKASKGLMELLNRNPHQPEPSNEEIDEYIQSSGYSTDFPFPDTKNGQGNPSDNAGVPVLPEQDLKGNKDMKGKYIYREKDKSGNMKSVTGTQ